MGGGLYRRLFGGHLADVLILCDGGCDVLLTGKETGLATPVEESTIAVGLRFCFLKDLWPSYDRPQLVFEDFRSCYDKPSGKNPRVSSI